MGFQSTSSIASEPPEKEGPPDYQEELEAYLRDVKLFVLPADDPRRAGLQEAVRVWMAAIAAKDVEGILAFVSSESRIYLRKRFRDPNYSIRRTLLYEGYPTYQLARSKYSGVMFIRTGTPFNPGLGIDVCFYDRAQHDPQTDEQRVALYRVADASVCYAFFDNDGRWYFSYSALEEGGPESYDPPVDDK